MKDNNDAKTNESFGDNYSSSDKDKERFKDFYR
jgi:hypothetical protein